MSQLIPCEICNQLVDFDEYANHIDNCLRGHHIARFFVTRSRELQPPPQSDGEEEDSDDEENSRRQHIQEINSFSRMFHRNSQITGTSLHDFIHDHFAGVSSPPSRQVIWYNMEQAANLSAANSYENNLRLGELMGKVERGLTEEQLKQIACTTSDKEKLKLAQDETCAICQENLNTTPEKLCLLACGHKYCDGCIKTWLEKNKKCPVCMIDLEDAFCWGRS